MPHEADIEGILKTTASLWLELRGARLFLTGGTGFFGSWLLQALLAADSAFDLRVRARVLTRDAAKFRRDKPHLAASPSVELVEGDVRDFSISKARYTHVIHAAGDPRPGGRGEAPKEITDGIVAGTRRVLELAQTCGATRFLYTSSGAVYGEQPAGIDLLSEEHPIPRSDGVPRSPSEAYALGKRRAEALCLEAAGRDGLKIKIARCFAFMGPCMTLTGGFAAADFIGDAVRGGRIAVSGDGTPLRSYLYAADLSAWLWTVLLRGSNGRAYNIGSEKAVSIADLAREVQREVSPRAEVHINKAAAPGLAAGRYVPSTSRARQELGLTETFDRREAIRRTADWFKTTLR